MKITRINEAGYPYEYSIDEQIDIREAVNRYGHWREGESIWLYADDGRLLGVASMPVCSRSYRYTTDVVELSAGWTVAYDAVWHK